MSNPKINDEIILKKEWQDEGDEEFQFIIVAAYGEGPSARFLVEARGTGINPTPTMKIEAAWIAEIK